MGARDLVVFLRVEPKHTANAGVLQRVNDRLSIGFQLDQYFNETPTPPRTQKLDRFERLVKVHLQGDVVQYVALCTDATHDQQGVVVRRVRLRPEGGIDR